MKIKELLKDKSKFLIIESVCLVLLLVFGYLGLGISVKGTSAVTYNCPSGYKAVTANVGDTTGTYVCCPTSTTWVTKESDGNYYCQDSLTMDNAESGVYVEIVNGTAVCSTSVDGYTLLSDDKHCSNQLGSSWTAGDCESNVLAGRICECTAPYTTCATKATIATQPFVGGSVKITGTNQVGSTLTAVVTDTTPAASYEYDWYYSYDSDYSDGGVLISGAKSKTFTIPEIIPGTSAATFVDKYIYVKVYASKTGYDSKYLTDITDSTNNGSATVKEKEVKQDFTGGSVKITGTNQVGSTLTAVVTDTTPAATYTYQWYYSYDSDYSDGGVVISGANASTYTIADTIPGSSAATFVDKYIYVQVFASKEGYNGKYLKDITDAANNSSATVKAKTTTATSEDTSPTKYTISYDANGGSGAPSAQTKTHGTNLTLSTTRPTRSNYTFKNWNTVKDGSGTSYAAGATYSSNASTTLFAQWTYTGSSDGSGGNGGNTDTGSSSKTYTATFNANGGTLNGSSSLECTTSGSSCSIGGLPTATKSGYTFKGWSTSSSCTSVSTGSLTLSTDTTYYACYDESGSSSTGGNNDTSDDSNDNSNNNDNNNDNESNNNDNNGSNDGNSNDNYDNNNNNGDGEISNPQTGEASIVMVFIVGIFAIGYAVWYFKNSKINKED